MPDSPKAVRRHTISSRYFCSAACSAAVRATHSPELKFCANRCTAAASDVVEIQNIGAGVCTVTAGTATVSTTGSLALAQNGSGRLVFTAAGTSIFQANGTAASASGATLISATTIGTTVSSVVVTGAFSSTYDNYMIIVNGGVGSVGTAAMYMRLGATTAGYYTGGLYVGYSTGTVVGQSINNGAQFYVGITTSQCLAGTIFLSNPNLAKNTTFGTFAPGTSTGGAGEMYTGFLNDTTQYTAFTIFASSGTLTGGTIRVYGMANS